MKISVDVSKLVLDSDVMNKIDLAKILEAEMQSQRTAIIKRTTAGENASGGSLKEYSKQYKQEIDSGHIYGKSPKNYTVNLTATGTMLRSMTTEAKEEGSGIYSVRMFFQGQHPGTIYVSERSAKGKRTKASKGGNSVNPNRGARGSATNRISAGRQAFVRAYVGGAPGRQSSKIQKGGGHGAHPSGITSAELAQYHYSSGRPGWMAFSTDDVRRVISNVAKALFRAAGLKIRR